MLHAQGLGVGSRIAIIMPMTPVAVALYLAVVYVGGAVVSVAESFSSAEMEARLRVGRTTLVFVQVRSPMLVLRRCLQKVQARLRVGRMTFLFVQVLGPMPALWLCVPAPRSSWRQ